MECIKFAFEPIDKIIEIFCKAKYQPVLTLRQLNLKLKYVDTDRWPNYFSMVLFMALGIVTGYLIAYMLALGDTLLPTYPFWVKTWDVGVYVTPIHAYLKFLMTRPFKCHL